MIHVTSNRLYNACHSGDIQAMCVQCTVYTVHVPEIYSMYKMWTEERESGWVTTIPNKKIVKTFFGCYTKKRIKNTLIVL